MTSLEIARTAISSKFRNATGFPVAFLRLFHAHLTVTNGRPRRELGYCTPEELFDAFLDRVYAVGSKLTCPCQGTGSALPAVALTEPAELTVW